MNQTSARAQKICTAIVRMLEVYFKEVKGRGRSCTFVMFISKSSTKFTQQRSEKRHSKNGGGICQGVGGVCIWLCSELTSDLFRDHSWQAQETLQDTRNSNLGQTKARQVPYLLYFSSAPRSNFYIC